MMQLNDAIRSERRKLGMTQKQLSEKSGVSTTTIANLELGRDPNVRTLRKIAVALNTTPAQLIERTT